MAEDLGELAKMYVKIQADQSSLEKEMSLLKNKVNRDSKEIQGKLSFKARFDTAIAKLRISELQALQKKLQAEFDKKIKLNVDASSLERTREKLASVKSALSGVNKEAEPSIGLFKQIGSGIAAAFGTAAIVKFGFEAVTLAGKVQGVKTAFDNLNQPGLLENLRKATRNTVSDFELMKVAMRASNFKIPLTELGTLLEFAQKRAQQTGQEVDYLVNSIIDGIGRKSTLVLDNLGISATELQQEFAKTGDFGKATANIIAREMKNMGDVVDTTATKVAQLNAQIENQKVAIGNQLTPIWSGLLKVLGGGLSLLTAMGQEFKRAVSPAKYYGDIIDELTEKHRKYANMLQNTYINQAKLSSFIVSTYKQQRDTVGQVKEKIEELVAQQENLIYGSKEYLKVQKEIEKLESSIGLGKQKKTEKQKVYDPNDIKAKNIGLDKDSWDREKDLMYENTNLMKIKRGELVLNMQETNQVMLDNSKFTTEAIFQDWIAKNQSIQDTLQVSRDVIGRAFDEIRVRASSNASAIENMFVDMGNIILNKFKEIAAEWAAMSFLRLIFGVATGGAAAAVPVGHSGGNFIGTSSGVKKMAGGGSFIVPPGFPNDSYPLLVESGERVTVNPTSQTGIESRLLRSIDRKLAILNSNTLEGQMSKSDPKAIPLYGKIENDAIYLSNKRASKLIGRMG